MLTRSIGQIIGATVTIGNAIADRLRNLALSVKGAAKELDAVEREIKSTTEVLVEIHGLYAKTEEQGMDVSATNTPEIQTLEQNIKHCRDMIESAQSELGPYLTQASLESTSQSHSNIQISLADTKVVELKGLILEINLKMTHGKLNLQMRLQAWSMRLFKTYAVIVVEALRNLTNSSARKSNEQIAGLRRLFEQLKLITAILDREKSRRVPDDQLGPPLLYAGWRLRKATGEDNIPQRRIRTPSWKISVATPLNFSNEELHLQATSFMMQQAKRKRTLQDAYSALKTQSQRDVIIDLLDRENRRLHARYPNQQWTLAALRAEPRKITRHATHIAYLVVIMKMEPRFYVGLGAGPSPWSPFRPPPQSLPPFDVIYADRNRRNYREGFRFSNTRLNAGVSLDTFGVKDQAPRPSASRWRRRSVPPVYSEDSSRLSESSRRRPSIFMDTDGDMDATLQELLAGWEETVDLAEARSALRSRSRGHRMSNSRPLS